MGHKIPVFWMNDVSPHCHILGSLKSEFSTSFCGRGWICLVFSFHRKIINDFILNACFLCGIVMKWANIWTSTYLSFGSAIGNELHRAQSLALIYMLFFFWINHRNTRTHYTNFDNNEDSKVAYIYFVLNSSQVLEVNAWRPKFEKLPPRNIMAVPSSASTAF